MLAGTPTLFHFVAKLLIQSHTVKNSGSLAISIYHDIGDVLNSIRYALTDYFPLRLDASFLQNSALGSPYTKWAVITNEQFEIVDFSFSRLLRAVARFYNEALEEIDPMIDDHVSRIGAGSAFLHIAKQFISCSVDQNEPILVMSRINLDDCIGPDLRFLTSQENPDSPLTQAVLSQDRVDITDRSMIAQLQSQGLAILDELVRCYEGLQGDLREVLNMDDVLAMHETRPKVYRGWRV